MLYTQLGLVKRFFLSSSLSGCVKTKTSSVMPPFQGPTERTWCGIEASRQYTVHSGSLTSGTLFGKPAELVELKTFGGSDPKSQVSSRTKLLSE